MLYVLLAGALLADVMLIGVVSYTIYSNIVEFDLGLAVLSAILIVACYHQWANAGGFSHWKFSSIRELLTKSKGNHR